MGSRLSHFSQVFHSIDRRVVANKAWISPFTNTTELTVMKQNKAKKSTWSFFPTEAVSYQLFSYRPFSDHSTLKNSGAARDVLPSEGL